MGDARREPRRRLRRRGGDVVLSNRQDGLRAEIWLPRASSDVAGGSNATRWPIILAARRDRPLQRWLAAGATVVHGDRAAAEWRGRNKFEPSRTGQPALVQRWTVAGDPGVDEEPVLVDQIQPVQLGRELAATEEDASRGRVLQLLYSRAWSPAIWWLLVHRKLFRVDDTTYLGLACSLTAHSRTAGGASSSPRATAGQ